MSVTSFSLKNILLGIILGLLIVVGWLFYPDVKAWFKSSTPPVAEKTMGIIKEKVGEIKIPLESVKKEIKEKIEEKLTEKKVPEETDETGKTAVAQTKSEPADKVKDTGVVAVVTEPSHKSVPPSQALAEISKPHYAHEESLWQTMLREPLDPEWIKDYPFSKCFKASATENNLPIALVLGLAGYMSNYEPKSTLDEKFGIMHLRWPNPARNMGIQEQDELISDACRNIDIACRFLAKLVAQSKGELVPAIVAFRNQTEMVHTGKIRKEELLFLSKFRRYVKKVMEGPFRKKTMYAFWKTDGHETAEDLMADIEDKSGVDLWLGQHGYSYIIYIPAASESEKAEKENRIKKETGMVAMRM